MTPASVYRQARSSVARSPHDIPRPAVSPSQPRPAGARHEGPRLRECHARLTADHAGRPEATATKGLNGPSGRTPTPGRSTYTARHPRQRGQIHGHGLLTVGGQEVGVTIDRSVNRGRIARSEVNGLQPPRRAPRRTRAQAHRRRPRHVPHRPERRAITAMAAPGTPWCHRCAATRVGASVIARAPAPDATS